MLPTYIDAYKKNSPLDCCLESSPDAQYVEAQDELVIRFRHAQSEDQIKECYQLLFKHLPHWASLSLLENNLPNLLDRSASLKKEQEQLAVAFGERYLQEGALKKAMLCFAKALQISPSQDNYLAAFKVFVHYFQAHQEKRLNDFLINPTPNPETIAFHIGTIKTLKKFGIPKESLIPFFKKLHSRISQVSSDKHSAYIAHEQAAFNLRNSSWELQQTPIERYWEALQTFRSCFANHDARSIQKEAFHSMKQLIALFIEDICTLIGSPPCDYDLRVMGSLGRREMCPYSDLECMLLIADEQHRSYFEHMLEFLELQIASFGETQDLSFEFTCIPNPSGFHLDNSPLQEKRLIQTPKQMAELQLTKTYAGNDIECTVLKTISLHQTTPQLYLDYQKRLQGIRKDVPFCFFDLCKQRIRDFSFAWKQHFDRSISMYNIKEAFVETLYHPLSDLALYFGIQSTNTLEIADGLIDRKFLSEKMRSLLNESIALIYQVRVRNHQQHGTQEEKARLTTTEIVTLEKCYWQILIPLYTCLKKLIDPAEPYRKFFEALCQNDSHVLTKQLKRSASILDAILHFPDSSTTRPIYTMKMDALRSSIIAITSPSSPLIPGEISVKIKAPHLRLPRSLHRSLTKKIMAGLDLKQEYSNSAHRVCRIQYGLYDLHLKQTPSNPLMEYAIHSLVSRIAGNYTPPNTLVRFDVEQRGEKKSYPVLISQTILGDNLKTAWRQVTPNRSYTWNLLVAILTKPQDGRLSNYILHEQNLFCIDNDLAFVEPVTKSGPFRKVHFSASPFCLFPLTTPLDQEVLEEFAALDTVGICKAWVEEIIEKEKEYLQLFTEQERKALYEEEGCTLNLLLREGTFSTLNLQFWQLQNTIQAAINQHKILTAGDLLQELVSLAEEKVGNYVYRAYNNTKATPEEKQQVALQRKQDSSVTAVEYHKNCLGKIPNFSEIEKLKKYSLEKASQELFHAFLIESEHAYLKDSQGKSALGANFKALKDSTREAKILLSINEFMKRSPQKILSLSFYYSTLLDKRKMESFLHPSLEKIDLRYCSNIDNDTIWLIQEKCPHLKEMTVIGCPKITNLGKRLFSSKLNFAHLKILEISHTPCTTLAFTARELNALNISYNLELIELDFEAPFLLEINAKKSEKIRLSPSARQDSIQAFARTPKTLATVPMLLVNEQEFLKNIIFKNGLALEYADTSLRNDTEVVLVAVKQNGLALQYASEELKSDREFVLAAVKQNGLALQYASEELKSDRKFVLDAVRQNGLVLQYTLKEFKSNREVVATAVQENGCALEYVSKILKSDKEVVLAAMQQTGRALKYASESIIRDKAFVLAALENNPWSLEHVSQDFKNDKEVVLAAVKRNGFVLCYASKELKSDRDIVLAAVQQNGLAFKYAAEELKNDKEIIQAALEQNSMSMGGVSNYERELKSQF